MTTINGNCQLIKNFIFNLYLSHLISQLVKKINNLSTFFLIPLPWFPISFSAFFYFSSLSPLGSFSFPDMSTTIALKKISTQWWKPTIWDSPTSSRINSFDRPLLSHPQLSLPPMVQVPFLTPLQLCFESTQNWTFIHFVMKYNVVPHIMVSPPLHNTVEILYYLQWKT